MQRLERAVEIVIIVRVLEIAALFAPVSVRVRGVIVLWSCPKQSACPRLTAPGSRLLAALERNRQVFSTAIWPGSVARLRGRRILIQDLVPPRSKQVAGQNCVWLENVFGRSIEEVYDISRRKFFPCFGVHVLFVGKAAHAFIALGISYRLQFVEF
jgi:hypothetical protein